MSLMITTEAVPYGDKVPSHNPLVPTEAIAPELSALKLFTSS